MRGGADTPSTVLREFVDRSGKHKTMAAYAGFDSGKVALQKEDGSEIKVPWDRLCASDQQYVAQCRLKKSEFRKAVKKDVEFQFDEPFKFTDSSGKKSLKATFIALHDGKAILWKPNGEQVSIAWKKLSDQSKKFVNTEIKRMR
ncbi:MAG: SHD1 domain-containing protein [Planctomycetota bacterium]